MGKLAERMRLDDVVLNLVFEGGSLIPRFIGGCQYNDPHGSQQLICTQLPQEFNASHFRKIQVQQDQ